MSFAWYPSSHITNHFIPKPNPNLIESKNFSGIKTLTVVSHTLRVVAVTILLGLCNPFSNPNTYPKRFGYALGLEKGLHNPNSVIIATDSNVHTDKI